MKKYIIKMDINIKGIQSIFYELKMEDEFDDMTIDEIIEWAIESVSCIKHNDIEIEEIAEVIE